MVRKILFRTIERRQKTVLKKLKIVKNNSSAWWIYCSGQIKNVDIRECVKGWGGWGQSSKLNWHFGRIVKSQEVFFCKVDEKTVIVIFIIFSICQIKLFIWVISGLSFTYRCNVVWSSNGIFFMLWKSKESSVL